MIITSLPVFGEITAVVFTANQVPRGVQHPDTISHEWSGLLKVDFFPPPQDFVLPFNTAYKFFLSMHGLKFLVLACLI